ncbi:uncharacterized protein LOC123309711 [Coccinella septempunctata]|uniref:uncharacterized protein LOC123309711 n=1 Tax=Coccinella septempunctata TaxID=41139 RepID=UPI001D062C82|nr:uncharacterized protein LOC123309711 [Coccinella septempunctata]
MKVLLICLILTIGCHSNEETNITSTTPSTTSTEFESLKLTNEIYTQFPLHQNTTENTKDFDNVTTEIPVVFKKKPFVKVKKLKKIQKTTYPEKLYRVKDENADLNGQESKFIGENPHLIQITHDSQPDFIDPVKNYSIKYKVTHDYKRGDSFSRSKYYPYGERKRSRNYHRLNRNSTEDKLSEESRKNENFVQFSYKVETVPQDAEDAPEQEPPTGRRRAGRPTLPEIQNVIHTLDSQDSIPTYKSPKQNHIVEVTEVPLVFEHHYQGDYKNPQSKFVAHQYSYSPPADPTNEALRLGKILSQNVVQKLQAAEEPLREYVQGQQEVILAGYTHGVPTYSFLNFNLNPSSVNVQNSHNAHPLMKYLAPEITPQSFSNDIRHFQRAQPNPYQFEQPQTHMEPIVVEDEEHSSDYETTYLHAVNRPQHHNQNVVTSAQTHPEQTYQNNENQHTQANNNVAKSPYSVNIQQHYMNLPKYTTVNNNKYNSKPQAIHEVEPPNLSGLAHSYNFDSIRYQVPSVLPTPFPDISGNPMYNAIQAGEEQQSYQGQQVENPNFKFEGLIPSTKLIHFVLPQQSPSTPTLVHHPRPQMISSRPFWRKPQVMKLVRLPERANQQQEEQSYQTQYQTFLPGHTGDDSRTRNQQLYQSLAEHYSTPVRMQQVLRSPKHHDQYQYPTNIMRLVAQQQESRNQFGDRPIVVEDLYDQSPNEEEETRDSPFAHESHKQQIENDSSKYRNLDEQNYQNQRPSSDSNTNQGNVEIVKAISKYYPQSQDNRQRDQTTYENTELHEGTSSVLPKGYLTFQQQKNLARVPNTRHIMPLVRYRNRENYDSSRRILNPRIRRLVTDLLKDNNRRNNVYVVMTEEE